MPLTLLAVFIGGAVGTSLRLAADALVPNDEFALSTLAVNVVGSFVLALLIGRVWARFPEWMRAGLGAGVLGAFTTFSAITVTVVRLSATGDPGAAAAYLLASLALGIAAAVVGLLLGGARAPRIDGVRE